MEVVVERRTLADECRWVQASLAAKPVNLIHNSVLLTADGLRLRISGSDGEVSSESSVLARVDAPGSAVVPRKLLSAVADLLPKRTDEATLALDESRLRVSCGPATFRLPTVPTETYPSLLGQPDHIGAVDAEELSTAVLQVGSAASSDDNQPVLTTVLLRFGPGKEMTLVATNKYRLGIKRIPWEPLFDDVREVKVPRRWLDRALKEPPPGRIDVSLSSDDAVFGLTVGQRRSVLPVFAGEFPPYDRLLALPFSTTAEFEIKDLTEALARLHIIASKPEIPVRILFGESEAVLAAGDADADATEAVACRTEGRGLDGAEVFFDSEMLLSALRSLRGEIGRMRIESPPKPVELTSAEEEAHVQLIVPLRL